MTPLPPPLGSGEIRLWRIDQERHYKTWNRGEGAFRVGGRWNTPGIRAVYASLDPATATAEAKKLQERIDYPHFDDNVTANGQSFKASLNDFGLYLGQINSRLMKDFDIYNRKDSRVQSFAGRVRKLATKHGIIEPSSVELYAASPDHGMGTGLVTTGELTFIPDPTISDEGGFGSQPDQKIIGMAAPQWSLLKQRLQVSQTTGKIGRSTHYVLAHLLNHQLNGSGKLVRNVVPFSGDGNKQHAKLVEKVLKELVHRGIAVKYDILLQGKVGLTPARQALINQCEGVQREILRIEQHLPSEMVASVRARQKDGTFKPIIQPLVIANFVPETIPCI